MNHRDVIFTSLTRDMSYLPVLEETFGVKNYKHGDNVKCWDFVRKFNIPGSLNL
jgi:hypothetical protein